MSTHPYQLHKKIDETTQTAQKALDLAKSAHDRLNTEQQRGEPGERGLKGDAGRDAVSIPGRDGKDAVGLTGATGAQGATGAAGKDGCDAPQRVEVDNLLAEYHRENKALRASFAALKQDFETLRLAFTSQDQKTHDYLAFLTARAEQRRKDKQQ